MLPTEKDSLWDYLLSISRISLPSHPITTVTPSASEEDTQLLRSNSTWLYLAFPCDSVHKTSEVIASSQETPCVPLRDTKLDHSIKEGSSHRDGQQVHEKMFNTANFREMKIKLQWGTTSLW